VVSYETIRAWCAKFGHAYASQLRRRRSRPGDKWHLDEVFVGDQRRTAVPWRAVDHGNVLDVLLQSRLNALAATRFFGKRQPVSTIDATTRATPTRTRPSPDPLGRRHRNP
jgi:putative transposase